ncbi:putative hydrolase YxeP [Stieleria maiorica]|uniref:Putative hydrolase YxeP n=1 Tax=Stieleria maiorica TaxID=2795974 RepID=A0A5B9M606_9BACT|nr:amidohydrolase [Stieleria maiorica]QEF96492.1 putative hydrolase YxeP [Stieleria maiorica]
MDGRLRTRRQGFVRIIMADLLSADRDSWVQAINDAAKVLAEGWIAMRRHLHQHPELSGHEVLTTQFLKAELTKLDMPVRVAGQGRGLTADLVTDKSLADHPRMAIRGDIDALPIQDEKSVPYHSTVDGVMHACGHDVHATVIIAAMQLLSHLHRSGALPWPIAARAILQPAEETAEGALHMIHHHAVANVGAILALHVDPTRQVGCIGLREHDLTAACDMLEVKFDGDGGHAARPHLTNDPIDACTRWIQSAYRRVHRAVNAHDIVVLSIGMIEAGHSPNVIPDHAKIKGTLRSLGVQARRRTLEVLEDVGEATARETGCQVSLRLGSSAPGVMNDPALVRLLSDSAAQVLNPAAVDWIDQPSMGSEDFSFYLEHVPGAMFRLGVAGDQVGSAPLHTGNFDVDEHAIAHAAKLFAASIINYFDPDRS